MNATAIIPPQSEFLMNGEASSATTPNAAAHLALEVMHEIRNPLEALGHLMFLAYEDADDPEAVRRYVKMAEEQMATLNRIASQTLGFARASVGLRPTNMVALAEAAFRIHQKTIDTRNIHLVKQLPEELAAEVHVGEILQVLSNLLANALDALADGGSLSFRLSKRNGEIHFVIADNGSGIPHVHLNQIFEPFFTTKEDQGTGLGLALSKRLIERHHGQIRVRSNMRPGRAGTAFRISLPA